MRGSRIRMFALALCLSVCLAALAVPALAADETLDVTYVEISGDGFVADSWLGVDAVYNLNGPTLYCSDLIERFYAQVYGLTVTTTPGTPEVAQSGYWFELTEAGRYRICVRVQPRQRTLCHLPRGGCGKRHRDAF